MGADRWITLAVVAASTGRLNYKEADSQDPRWRQREALILRQIEHERVLVLQQARMQQKAASAIWPQWDKEGKLFFTFLEEMDRLWELMWSNQLPYDPLVKKAQASDELGSWKERWEAKFGPLNSPEVKEQERKLVEKLKKDAIEAQKVRAARERADLHRDDTRQRLLLERTQRRNQNDLRLRR